MQSAEKLSFDCAPVEQASSKGRRLRTLASSLLATIRAAFPDELLLGYGSHSKFFVGIGARTSITLFESAYHLQANGTGEVLPVRGEGWSALERFTQHAHSELEMPVFGFVNSSVSERSALPTAVLVVPEIVLELSANNLSPRIIYGASDLRKIFDVANAIPKISEWDNPLIQMPNAEMRNALFEEYAAQDAPLAMRFPLDCPLGLTSLVQAPLAAHPHYRSFYFYLPEFSYAFGGNSPTLAAHGSGNRFSMDVTSGFTARGLNPVDDVVSFERIKFDSQRTSIHESYVSEMVERVLPVGNPQRLGKRLLTLSSFRVLSTSVRSVLYPNKTALDYLSAVMPEPHLYVNLDSGMPGVNGVQGGAFRGLMGVAAPGGQLDFTRVLQAGFSCGDTTFIDSSIPSIPGIRRESSGDALLDELELKARSVLVPLVSSYSA